MQYPLRRAGAGRAPHSPAARAAVLQGDLFTFRLDVNPKILRGQRAR
jgi:hypothetical protein